VAFPLPVSAKDMKPEDLAKPSATFKPYETITSLSIPDDFDLNCI
jgi:hypothetical protein